MAAKSEGQKFGANKLACVVKKAERKSRLIDVICDSQKRSAAKFGKIGTTGIPEAQALKRFCGK